MPESLAEQNAKVRLRFQGSTFQNWSTEGVTRRIKAPIQSSDSVEISVTLSCNRYFVPYLIGENEDTRIVSVKLLSLQAARY